MAMSAYQKKLLDPRWQRKRLEVLDAAGWSCECCGDTKNTLHVHHKRYIKGREPWEYERNRLEVLCEECHQCVHAYKDQLNQVLSEYPSWQAEELFSLLVGFGSKDGQINVEHFLESDGATAQAGVIASTLRHMAESELLEVKSAIQEVGPFGFADVVVLGLQQYRANGGKVLP